jgi:serine/threonine protein kinase/tetratricopeptide (TPR) repeat protein
MQAEFHSVKELFLAALEKDHAAERLAYLDEACGSDRDLRQRVDALLARHEAAGSFLEAPPDAGDATREEQPIAERPGTIIGPYKLMEQIGEGGMGLVFVAEQQRPVRRKVALKIIKPGMGTRQVVARFEAERQALALMDHPNIAKVHDGGETASGRPYFVMELVKGLPITDYCDQAHFTPNERLELFISICQAVEHAHQKGIIHRDIKPSNVLVTQQDGAPLVKVIDFGIAKALGQRLTEKTVFTGFAQLIGSPLYMSPEQAALSNVDVDTRSDIYALGVLLYELLTGTTPFEKERLSKADYDEIRRIIREEEPPKPSTRLRKDETGRMKDETRRSKHTRWDWLAPVSSIILHPSSFQELDWIVMKALEKDRNRRYDSASALAADVRRYIDDEAVQACPPSKWYRLHKFARRKKSALAMAACVFLTLAGIAAAVGWTVRDRAARDHDQQVRDAALDAEVSRALDETGPLIEQGKWPEALAVVERADKLLAAAGRTEQPPRLEELRRDLVVAQRLENVNRRPTGSSAEECFWGREQDRLFAQEFRDIGIDVNVLDKAEAAARTRRSGIRTALVKALDQWATMRRRARGENDSTWKKLVAIAQEAESDEWRNRFRTVLLLRDREALERLVDSLPTRDVPPATILLLGTILQELGALNKAMAVLREGQRQYPDDLWINDQLAWYYRTEFRPPRYQEAVRFYAIASALRPRWPRGHLALAQALADAGSWDEAVAEVSKAIELDRTNPWLWMRRARIHHEHGQFEKAVADSSKAIELDANYTWAWSRRGVAYFELGQWEKAVADCSKAIELDPRNADAWNYRGYAYTQLLRSKKDASELSKELSDRSEAIKQEPNSARTWYWRGHAYLELGEFEKANADLSKGIELDPDCRWPWSRRALARLNLGQWDKAVADCIAYTERAPGEVWAWYRLAALHLKLGDLAAYRRCCREMLDRFGKTDTCAVAEKVAKTCSLAPDAVSDFAPVVRLTDVRAKDQEPDPWYLLTKGLVEYRAGRPAGALALLKRMAPKTDGKPRDAAALAVTALAEHRLGHGKEARAALDTARAILAEKLPDPAKKRYFGNGWHDWLHAEVLYREAEEILKREEEPGFRNRESPQK